MKILSAALFCCFFLAQTLPGASQVLPPMQRDKIRFDLDYASFKAEAGKVRLELYYSFYLNQFRFAEQNSQRIATFVIDTRIFQQDSLLERQTIRRTSTLPLNKRLSGKEVFLTISRFELIPGQYKCLTTIADRHAEAAGAKELQLDLTPFDNETLTFSDIELASSIAKDTSQSLYTKHDYQVIPNPPALYAANNPMLYFYSELYAPQNAPPGEYKLEYKILNNDGSVYRSYAPQPRQRPTPTSAEVGGLNVVTFPSGQYQLQLNLLDADNQPLASQTKTFYTLRHRGTSPATDLGPRQLAFLREEYKNVGLKEIDIEFKSASYMATREEKTIFKSLDLAGKQRFMAEFWARRAEKREEHLKRLRYANQNFTRLHKGWKTDRGRITIKYGQPDRTEKNFSMKERRAYEVWRYFNAEEEGSIFFVFVDKGGSDDLELVHSTARTEVSDPNWRRWIE
ncbi:MAG: GWxTD domain-containing protein [bacterium]